LPPKSQSQTRPALRYRATKFAPNVSTTDKEKLAILKETTQPGVIVAAVARRHGIGTGQLYTWRKQLLRGAMAGFVDL
jgi:transposase-like protein